MQDRIGWQPIETAPKDGTVVDLWNEGRYANCAWHLDPHDDEDTGSWCQQQLEISGSLSLGHDFMPTYWMPLPIRLMPETTIMRLPPRDEAWGIVPPNSNRPIMSSIRSANWAALLCFLRDHRLSRRGFDEAGFRLARLKVEITDA